MKSRLPCNKCKITVYPERQILKKKVDELEEHAKNISKGLGKTVVTDFSKDKTKQNIGVD
jgi:hypothetical protein